MIKNTLICIAMLISSGFMLTSCGPGEKETPPPSEKVTLEKKGTLGTNTYELFDKGSEDHPDQIKNLNALLKKVRNVYGKSYANNAAREKALDDLNIEPVAGIDVAAIKAAMLADKNLDSVKVPFVCAAGLKVNGEVCALFKAAHEANADKVEAIKTIMNVLKDKSATTRTKLADSITNDTSLASLVNALAVTTITIDDIKTAMLNDSGLPVATGLHDQRTLGVATYALFSDAADRDETKVGAINTVLDKVVTLDAANYADKEARDAAVANSATITDITDAEITAIGDAAISRDAIKNALQADKALVKAQGTLGAAAYGVFTTAAGTAYGQADRRTKVDTLNSLLDFVTSIHANAVANRIDSDGDRRTQLATREADFTSVGITLQAIGDAMQTDKHLKEALAANPFAPKTSIYALFSVQAAGANAAKITALNNLLTKLATYNAKDFDGFQSNRDACIDNNAACADVGDKIDDALLNNAITGITRDQIKTAMQADKPLIVNLADSRLVHQTIYDAIVDNRGTRTPEQVNTLMAAVVAAITANPEPNTTRSDTIVGAAADAAYGGLINAAVNHAYPKIDVDAIFGATSYLATLFRNAIMNPTNSALKNDINNLVNQVESIYREDDGSGGRRAKTYTSKARIEMAVDGLGIAAAGVAGITAASIKTAWLTDAATLPDLTLQANTGFRPTNAETTAVYDAIRNRAPGGTGPIILTNPQAEKLFEDILEVAKHRPRVVIDNPADANYNSPDNRNALAEGKVIAVVGAASRAALTAEQQALVTALNSALEDWLPALNHGTDVSVIPAKPATMSQELYDAITKFDDEGRFPIEHPNNKSIVIVLRRIATNIIDVRPQPNDLGTGQINALFTPSGTPLTGHLWDPWKSKILGVLADPNTGIVALKPKTDYVVLHQDVYDIANGALFRSLTNKQKNSLFAVLNASATAQQSTTRFKDVVDMLSGVGFVAEPYVGLVRRGPALAKRDAIRALLYELSDKHPSLLADGRVISGAALGSLSGLNENGTARKYKVIETTATEIKIKKVTIGQRGDSPAQLGNVPYTIPIGDRTQSIPLEPDDFVWFYGTSTSGPRSADILLDLEAY